MARIPKPYKYLPMTLPQLWQSIFKFKQDEIFISWFKRFLVGYNLLFAGLTITFIIANPPIPSGLYLIFLAVIIITFFLLWIPLRWFQVILPFSIPGYIVFIHFFLNYTGGSASPYFPLYFLPVILASFLFSYKLYRCRCNYPACHTIPYEFGITYFLRNTFLSHISSFYYT